MLLSEEGIQMNESKRITHWRRVRRRGKREKKKKGATQRLQGEKIVLLLESSTAREIECRR